MKPRAIVYTSNTGHTAAYAALLSERIDLPAYTLDEAMKQLQKGCPIIYLGWIMAGKVKGYKKAERRFDVRVACGVGMTAGGMNADRLRKTTFIRDDIDLHAIPGGFELDKLTGPVGAIMRRVSKRTARDLRAKPKRTPAEEEMLMLMTRGAALIDPERLNRLAAWYAEQK